MSGGRRGRSGMMEGEINMTTDKHEVAPRIELGDLVKTDTPTDFVRTWRDYLKQDAPKPGDVVFPEKQGLVKALEWLDSPEVKAAIEVEDYSMVLDLAKKRVEQYESAAKVGGKDSVNYAIYMRMDTFVSMLEPRMPGGRWARRDSNSRSSS